LLSADWQLFTGKATTPIAEPSASGQPEELHDSYSLLQTGTPLVAIQSHNLLASSQVCHYGIWLEQSITACIAFLMARHL